MLDIKQPGYPVCELVSVKYMEGLVTTDSIILCALPLLALSTCSKSSTNLITFGNSSSHTFARKWSNVVFWSADLVSFSCRKKRIYKQTHS